MAARAAVAATLVLVSSAYPTKYELLPYESVADARAVVVAGSARFTVLTERLVRMEYDEARRFEDRPTLSVVNRKLHVPAFVVSRARAKADAVRVTTQHFELVYAGGLFGADTLRIGPAAGAAHFERWHFGMVSERDPLNLRGTIRTLDGLNNVSLDCARHEPSAHCQPGLVSRSGWALLDDTAAPVLDEAHAWWTDASGALLRSRSAHDLYLFAHGRAYEGALHDFSRIGGAIPLIPRRNLGVWFTRWYDYDASAVRAVVDGWAEEGLPLDVFVFDMNWHTKHDWTGYSWDRTLYPRPEDTLADLRARGLAVAGNLHDANGVGTWEEGYEALCAQLGLDPSAPPAPKGVPLDLRNRSYLAALDDQLLRPLETAGVDFWWIDWQQGPDKGGTGQDPRGRMNPTIALSRARVTNHARRCAHGLPCTRRRGVTLARWGGLGSHRYQHGFSGDVQVLSWANLAYQAYFSATASNVGYGLWSHDIVGPGSDPELFVRWVQLGSYSAILRLHERGLSAGSCFGWPTEPSGCALVEPFKAARAYYEPMRAALRARAALVPYLYTAAAEAHARGLSLTRPLYYSYPEEPSAYPADMDALLGQDARSAQYMLGGDLLVAPVTRPAVPPPAPPSAARLRPEPAADLAAERAAASPTLEPSGLAPMRVWLPPGAWLEEPTGRLLRAPAPGGLWLERALHLTEYTAYVRGGAALPSLPPAGSRAELLGAAGRAYAALEFTVHPGAAAGAGEAYEDDGDSEAYLRGQWARTRLTYTLGGAGGADGASVAEGGAAVTHANISTTGWYAGIPSAREYTVRLRSALPAAKVVVARAGGAPSRVGFDRLAGTLPGATCARDSWSYDGARLELRVRLCAAAGNTRAGFVTALQIVHVPVRGSAPAVHAELLNGLRFALSRARLAKAVLDETRSVPGGSRTCARGAGGALGACAAASAPPAPSPPQPQISALAAASETLGALAGDNDSGEGFVALATRARAELLPGARAEVQALQAGASSHAQALRFAFALALLDGAVQLP